MTTIYERIYSALSTLGVPVAADANRAALGDPLPDIFIVFSEISAVPAQAGDDDERERVHYVRVSVFSRDGLVTAPDTDSVMSAAGSRFTGETPIPYDDETLHYGGARDYMILLNQ